MQHGSLRLGSLFGIRVNLHWSVAVIAVLLGANLWRALTPVAATVGVVAFLVSILVHEFAHALTARRYGVGTESIQLWALGGIARLKAESPTARAEGWIAAAGPLASLALAVLFLGAWWGTGSPGGSGVVLGWLGIINGLIAVFNLLPGAPLDGGRIVKAVRWGRHGNRHRAGREAARAGLVLAWLIMTVGFALLVRGEGGLWLLVTGLFILANAQVEIGASRIAEQLDHVSVGDLTWYGVAQAGPEMDADSMLWQRSRLGHAGGVAVTDAAGRLSGLVIEDSMWDVPADQRPWVLLTQLMVPFDDLAQASPDEPLSSVLPRLNPRTPAISVWRDGRLVGLVSPDRVREQLRRATHAATA